MPEGNNKGNNMRKSITVLVTLVLILGLAACASTNVRTAKQAGLISKHAAESAYVGIYTAYRAGKVSEGDMVKADTLYDQWRAAQIVFVSTIQLSESGVDVDVDVLSQKMVVLANTLLALAVELEAIDNGN